MKLPDTLWKLTIDPRGKRDPSADPFAYCRERGIVGIGWGLETEPQSKEDAERAFREEHEKGIRAFRAMVYRMDVGDHVWVYGDRRFYVCRVESEWRHEMGDPWRDHDVRNVRDAAWRPVPLGLVPGRVKRHATMYGTCHAIPATDELRRYSAWAWENERSPGELAESLDYQEIGSRLADASPLEVFRDVLDPDDTEDLVGLYLQRTRGWAMLKSSAYRSKARVECEFQREGSTGPEVGYMQVKSGNVPIDLREYSDLASENEYVYLFSTAEDPYQSLELRSDHLVPLKPEPLFAFLREELTWLPVPIAVRLGIWIGSIGNGSEPGGPTAHA